MNFSMALALSQLIDRQSELFIRISYFIDNIKKLGKDNINCEVLEIRLDRLRKSWPALEKVI